ncbi:MAG: PAS domain S-box protein, partial [Candidatus Competibacteraceae bacterium]|nr:PAS domain S-box protein [Candidatus Competibacteraceae bacterium]
MSAKFTLQDYEQPFQTLFEHSTNAVFLIGADCRYVTANPAGLRLLGYTQSELQQLRFSDQLSGYEPSTDAPATSVMPGQTQTERWEHQRKDGSHFPAQIHSCALSDTAFLTTIHDLSRQTPAASAVPPEQDAMLRLQAAVRASQVGLWDWDLNTNQVYYSAEWKRQIGYGEQEISNDFSEWQLRVHPDDLARMQHAVQAYLKEPDRGFQQEFRFRHKDGSYRWIYTQASLIYDATGQASHMLGSHIDITEHQQLAAQQYAADRQRAVLLESISDAFLALDGDWCFTYVNSKAGELINRRPETLLGKHIWTEIPEAVGQEFYYVYQKAMTERVPVKREAFFPPWDRWFESRMYPAQDGGLSVYFTDVTTRKQAET